MFIYVKFVEVKYIIMKKSIIKLSLFGICLLGTISVHSCGGEDLTGSEKVNINTGRLL